MSAIPITIAGDVAQVRFSTFDLAEYDHFLTLKKTLPTPEMDLSYDWQSDIYTVQFPARYAAQFGADVRQPFSLLPMAPDTWDYQRYFVGWALKRKRAAFFWDCGLGKTRAFLEFARQAMAATGRKALIVSIAGNLISQTIRQAKQFYGDNLPILRIETREQLIEWLGTPTTETRRHRDVFQGNNDGKETRGLDCILGGNSHRVGGRENTSRGDWESDHKSQRYKCEEALAIVNYEKFIPGQIAELRNLGALILDESSILKTGGGKIKWNIIHSAKGIEYKLSNTATPAPNEAMEYASQASFLETIRTEGDVIWTYFKKNDDGSWRLIKHAEKAFYKFLAGWSVFMRSPAAYGFKDNIRPVPKPEYLSYNVPATNQQLEEAQRYRFEIGAGLLGNERMGVKERLKLSQIAKGFIYEKQPSAISNQRSARAIPSLKPEFIATLMQREYAAHRHGIVWTVFDEEGEILSQALRTDPVWVRALEFKCRFCGREAGRPCVAADGTETVPHKLRVDDIQRLINFEGKSHREVPHEILSGKTKPRDRERIIENFQTGKLPWIISKAEMLGYGMDLPQGSSMIFSGWNDSFEQWYQAIRRFVRYGQTEQVRIHVPMIEGLEDAQLDNIMAKAAAYEEQASLQEEAYREALGEINLG